MCQAAVPIRYTRDTLCVIDTKKWSNVMNCMRDFVKPVTILALCLALVLQGCMNGPRIDNKNLRGAAKSFDKIDKYLERFGTASVSSMLIVENKGQFALDYNQPTSEYVAKARSGYQGAAQRFYQYAKDVQQAQVTQTDAEEVAKAALLGGPQGAALLDVGLTVASGLGITGAGPDTAAALIEKGEVEQGAPAFTSQLKPNAALAVLNSPTFSDPLPDFTPPTELSERRALLIGVNDKITENILKYLAYPQGVPANKLLYIGILEVSVNPGWGTREGYMADVVVTPEYARDRGAEVQQSLEGAQRKLIQAQGNLDRAHKRLKEVQAIIPSVQDDIAAALAGVSSAEKALVIAGEAMDKEIESAKFAMYRYGDPAGHPSQTSSPDASRAEETSDLLRRVDPDNEVTKDESEDYERIATELRTLAASAQNEHGHDLAYKLSQAFDRIRPNDKTNKEVRDFLSDNGVEMQSFLAAKDPVVAPGSKQAAPLTLRELVAKLEAEDPTRESKSLNGYYFQNEWNETSGKQPVVLAAFPLLEAQTLDLRNSERTQDAFVSYMASLLLQSGVSQQNETLTSIVERLEYDSASRSPIPLVTSYASGDSFGFQFMPAFQALADPSDSERGSANVLHPYSFPALVLLQCEESEVAPVEDGGLGLNMVRLNVSSRWIPMKNRRMDTPARYASRARIGVANELDRAVEQLRQFRASDADDAPFAHDEAELRLRQIEPLATGVALYSKLPSYVAPAKPDKLAVAGVLPTEGLYNASTVLTIKGAGFAVGEKSLVKSVTVAGRNCEFVVAGKGTIIAIVPPWTTDITNHTHGTDMASTVVVATTQGAEESKDRVTFKKGNVLHIAEPDPTVLVQRDSAGRVIGVTVNGTANQSSKLMDNLRAIVEQEAKSVKLEDLDLEVTIK